jgi:hypothetical protein
VILFKSCDQAGSLKFKLWLGAAFGAIMFPVAAHASLQGIAQRQKEDPSSGCSIAGRIVSPPLLYTLDQLSQTDWYNQIGSSVGVFIGRRHG